MSPTMKVRPSLPLPISLPRQIQIGSQAHTEAAGRTRIERLYTIGCTSLVQAVPAIAAAIAEAKSGKDVKAYTDLVETLSQIAPEDSRAEVDTDWVETKTKQVRQNMERLESELTQYKNNMIKESIRVSRILLMASVVFGLG
jgi:hypothetical protein